MPLYKIPVNHVEVKDYEIERDSFVEAIECIETMIEAEFIEKGITSINYKELLKRQLAESKKEEVEYLSFKDWVNKYSPILNPLSLVSGEMNRTTQWESYLFDAKVEEHTFITCRTPVSYVWTVLKDSCNGDNPYKAVSRYFSKDYDFDLDDYSNIDDITWSPYLSVFGYFITSKTPETTTKTLFINL